MNLPGKGQSKELGDKINEHQHLFEHHSPHHDSASHHRAYGNDLIGSPGNEFKHHDITSSNVSTSAADTLSMLTQSMLGTMPSAVATAAAAGLFMRVSGGANSGPDTGGGGTFLFNWNFMRIHLIRCIFVSIIFC